MSNLNGKKYFVTGGSRGIGAAIVKHLADSGAQVAFTYSSNEAKAQDVLKALKGSGHFCVQMDVSNAASVESACAQVLQTWPDIDGVVNNA
jgi:3-oxoacyl-[acyl-carrier protein] reductase